MMRQAFYLLLACCITMLLVGINLNTMTTLCLAFELGVCALFGIAIYRKYTRPDEEKSSHDSARATIPGPDDRGPDDSPTDIPVRTNHKEG